MPTMPVANGDHPTLVPVPAGVTTRCINPDCPDMLIERITTGRERAYAAAPANPRRHLHTPCPSCGRNTQWYRLGQ